MQSSKLTGEQRKIKSKNAEDSYDLKPDNSMIQVGSNQTLDQNNNLKIEHYMASIPENLAFRDDIEVLIKQEKIKKQQFPREVLPEQNEDNLDLGGCYQKTMYCLGTICGGIRAIIPCCCCVKYPYVRVSQGQKGNKSNIKQKKGIFQRFGKYVSSVQAGLQFVNPCTDTIRVISEKVQVIDLARQSSLTKDNILVKLDCVVFFRITCARKAVFALENISKSIAEMAVSTIRALVGKYKLQELLEKRQEISVTTKVIIEEYTSDWGIDIQSVLIKDIDLSDETMNNLQSAAKERRLAVSKIISAKADLSSAKFMREAADILSSDSSMQIRYLRVVDRLAQFSKLVFIDDQTE